MTNPIVSIITPTYNHEKFIGICIESVLKQTYQNWEMIIIDDDSTDRTARIIKKYTDPRIRYIHQEHLGVYKLGITYNKALTMAQGEIIAILEGDDFWPDYKLEHQIPAFNDANVILTYGDVIGFDQNGKIFSRYQPSVTVPDKQIRENRPIGSALKELLKRTHHFITPPTVCIKKGTLLKIGGFIHSPYLPLVDSTTFCHLALEGEFKYFPETLGYGRRHPQNTTAVEFFNINVGIANFYIDFLTRYQERIQALKIDIDINYLRRNLQESSIKFNLSHEYLKGCRHLEIWEKQSARRCFFQHLKRHKKRFSLSLMSLVGIFSSYLGINLIRQINLVVGHMKHIFQKQ
ncbi:MAG: glycosyltransferase family 2 protein [Planctomycetota bacterium]